MPFLTKSAWMSARPASNASAEHILVLEARGDDLLFFEGAFDLRDPVPEFRGPLVLHLLRRFLHALLQHVDEVAVLAFQEKPDLAHHVLVLALVCLAAARRQAAADLELDAGPRGLVRLEFDPAGGDGKRAPDERKRLPHAAGRNIGPVVERAVLLEPPHDFKPGIF